MAHPALGKGVKFSELNAAVEKPLLELQVEEVCVQEQEAGTQASCVTWTPFLWDGYQREKQHLGKTTWVDWQHSLECEAAEAGEQGEQERQKEEEQAAALWMLRVFG